jgi:hypothetical protein
MYDWRKRKKTRVAPKARSKEEKCVTPRCRNRKATKYTYYKSPKTGERITYVNLLNHCWKCRSRMLKERQPATYVLNAIRQRAKQRKLPFTITLEEFEKWCAETGYLEKRGREPESYSIDRIDHDKGYHIWNIQIKTFEENCTSGHTVPGRETMQNERKPEVYDYDFKGPQADQPDETSDTAEMAVAATSENNPF